MSKDTLFAPRRPFEAHPAAAIFPMMDDEEFSLLKADIQKHGQRSKVVLYKGEILDGRNRYRACCELGIEPDTWELGDDDTDPIAFVISANLARRHLSKSQAAAIAAEHLPMFTAEAEVRKAAGQKTGGKARHSASGKNLPQAESGKAKAVERAAEAFSVSPETVRQAAKVKEASPELHEQVKSGHVTVNAATKRIRETPAPKSETVDGNGLPIPLKAQHAFRARHQFRSIVQQIGKLSSEIETLAEHPFAGAFLAERLNAIRTDLKNAQRAVKFCAPHQICPYCKGGGCEKKPDGKKTPCRETGWTIRGVKGGGE